MNHKVLICDDSEVDLLFLKQILSKADCTVLTATNAEDAIKLAKKERPDLIFMDIYMPVMDGNKACRILTNDSLTQDIPVIMVSGVGQRVNQAWSKIQGAKDFVVKPFKAPEILAHLKTFLKKDIDKDSSKLSSAVSDAEIKKYGIQLFAVYPDISSTLIRINGEINPSDSEELFSKLGKALGRWNCKANYSLGGELSMENTLTRMVWPSLKKSLKTESEKFSIKVIDCPFCQENKANTKGCFFFNGYIQGFLNELNHLPSCTINQTSQKSLGDSACTFEVISE